MEKVSLIMTTYNCIDHFILSIESALSQDYPSIELVIIDGGSTDGTAEVISRYAKQVNCTDRDQKSKGHGINRSIKWKSEPDEGIYDGMNKGIRMATGDVIAVFNDLFTRSDAISELMGALDSVNPFSGKKYDGVHSDLVYMDGNTCKRYWRMGDDKARYHKSSVDGSISVTHPDIHFGWMPAHPTLYLRREVYSRFGLYNTKFRSSSDYDYMLRILTDKNTAITLTYIPEVLISMYYGGTSNSKGYMRNVLEAYRALVINRIAFPLTAIICRTLRTIKQYTNTDFIDDNKRFGAGK